MNISRTRKLDSEPVLSGTAYAELLKQLIRIRKTTVKRKFEDGSELTSDSNLPLTNRLSNHTKRNIKKRRNSSSTSSSSESSSSSNSSSEYSSTNIKKKKKIISDLSISLMEKTLIKKYHSEIEGLTHHSEKLSAELIKEKKKQKLLRWKLGIAIKKQMEETKIKKIKNAAKRKKQNLKNCSNSDSSDEKSKKHWVDVHKLKKRKRRKEKIKSLLEGKDKEPVPEVLTLKQKMEEKLKAARFRFLNEQIYTTDSKEAQKIFLRDPDAFKAYHEGYNQQIKSWPFNPLDIIIKTIKRMPKSLVVADFGCGEAKLSKSVSQRVYSFDLVAIDDTVTACDMSHVPLQNSSVDLVVFCLSLMSTNLGDYLLEANRVLKTGGTVKIVEVASRFERPDDFIKAIQYFGFKLLWKDLTQNFFYFMDFQKHKDISDKRKLPTFKLSLQPCLYKKR